MGWGGVGWGGVGWGGVGWGGVGWGGGQAAGTVVALIFRIRCFYMTEGELRLKCHALTNRAGLVLVVLSLSFLGHS